MSDSEASATTPQPAERPDDRRTAIAAVFAFSFALGIGALAIPLLALAAGYDAATVGLLAATSAIAQFTFRLRLPHLLATHPDRTLIMVACVAMASAYALLFLTRSLPVFVIAQLLQGGARALFWTASQTHAVRSRGTAVQSLSLVGGTGNVSQMLGPLVTGFLAGFTLMAPLILAGVSAVTGLLLASRLVVHPPYAQRSRRTGKRLWLRPGVDAACWAGFVGGGWRALMSSYVPLALKGAGQVSGTIGVLMSMADLAGTGVVMAMARVRVANIERGLVLAVGVACVTLALVPVAAPYALAAGILLAVSGGAAAPITALTAAAARQRVDAEDEGEAIALVGTFRAGALLVAPAGVAAVVGAVTVAPALAIASLLLGIPIVLVETGRRITRGGDAAA